MASCQFLAKECALFWLTAYGYKLTQVSPGKVFEEGKKGIKGKAKWLVYLNHFITGWDDHIWMFALGLFLVEITPESLQFTATYGLAAGCAVLLFGTVVGDWVDHTPRLTVARVSVLVQNSALIACSILIYLVMTYKTEISTLLPGEALLRMCYVFIVVIAIVSNLTNMARTTAIERDWIVEICDNDKDMLASLSATMRRISLATKVIAPIVIGQILSRTSHPTGALVVAAWNFMTIFLEYFLLWKIYRDVPQLHRLKIRGETMETRIHLMDGADDFMEFTDLELKIAGTTEKPDKHHEKKDNDIKGIGQSQSESSTGNGLGHSNTSVANETGKTDTKTGEVLQQEKTKHISDCERNLKKRKTWQKLFTSCITLHKGWRIYKSYDVAFAGLGLASLYLTVLGFHYITTGYVYGQGLSEDLIGGLRGAAALNGILGTILYPIIRRKVGLLRTGLYALAAQICSLTLCVISVFAPGSPFDPFYFTRSAELGENVTVPVLDFSTEAYNTSLQNISYLFESESYNATDSSLYTVGTEPQTGPSSYASIALLMAGIIGSRAGLWMADLTITQMFLETVDVTERGIVNGVQNAVNQLMELIKFAIVILLPVPEVFGFLVFISFFFICLGWVLVAVYVNRARGYLLPCNEKKYNRKDTT